MDSEIHKKKIALLSKLLEEKRITLSDCLLLLDEENPKPLLDPNRLYGPTPLRPHTPWPNPHPGPAPYGGGHPWNQYVGDMLQQSPVIYFNTGTGTPPPINTISTNASL